MVALLLAFVAASAFGQQLRGPLTRVPRGGSRIGTGPSQLAQLTRVHPERQTSGKPFVGPVPFPSSTNRWIRIETPHFQLISSAGERRTRGIAEELERLAATLLRTSSHFHLPAQRTRVFLFTHRSEIQPYFDAVRGLAVVDVTGLTVREKDRSTILIDANARGGERLTARHELVHDLLRRGNTSLPLWLEEGLAEYYSNAGQPVREHVSLLRTRFKVPLEFLFAIDLNTRHAGSFYFYAKSWAVVSTLIRRDESTFFSFVGDVADGSEVPAALSRHYRLSYAQLEGATRGCAMPVPLMALDLVSVPMVVAPVERAELLTELGRLLAVVPGREDEATRHFAAAANERSAQTF